MKKTNETAYLLSVALHDVVDLLELVGEPLLAGELVLLQGEDQLLVVLHSIPGDDKDDDRQERVDGWLHERFSFHWKVDAADPPLGHLTSWESDEGLRMLMKRDFPQFCSKHFFHQLRLTGDFRFNDDDNKSNYEVQIQKVKFDYLEFGRNFLY